MTLSASDAPNLTEDKKPGILNLGRRAVWATMQMEEFLTVGIVSKSCERRYSRFFAAARLCFVCPASLFRLDYDYPFLFRRPCSSLCSLHCPSMSRRYCPFLSHTAVWCPNQIPSRGAGADPILCRSALFVLHLCSVST
jgi:hypothetical protein